MPSKRSASYQRRKTMSDHTIELFQASVTQAIKYRIEIAKLKELLIERDGILADQFKDLKELNDRVLLIELGQQHDKTTPH